MFFSLFLVFLAVVLTGISQVLLKIGSAHQGKSKEPVLAAYLFIPTFFAYGLLVFVTVISVIALQEIPLKTFYAIASMNFYRGCGAVVGNTERGGNKKNGPGNCVSFFRDCGV